MVCVTAPQEQLDQAVEIMNSAGAVDIDRRVAAYRETGYERHDRMRRRTRTMTRSASASGSVAARRARRSPSMEEELQVGKRAVKRGGVRVYSHVVEQPVEESIELREEHV